MKKLQDRFGRRFPYLRLSVTDVCNFSCSYCLPNGYQKTKGPSFLNLDEVARLARAFAELGTWKIRLTGGEPTLRKDFLDIVRIVAETPGIEKLALTTNGYHLPERAQDFYSAGLRAINISIDSMKPRKFKAITGHDRLAEVLSGVEAAENAGFQSIKINTVLLRNTNDDELDNYLEFIRSRDISLRFIELMRTNDNQKFFKDFHVCSSFIQDRLVERGWSIMPRVEGAGPAVEFAHPDYVGTIGLIAPYSKDFCASCNRLRMSAKGDLHLCLFGAGGYSVRDLLQRDDQLEELKDKIVSLVSFKRKTHFLHQDDSGATPHLASIGG